MNKNFFEKGIDFWGQMWYTIGVGGKGTASHPRVVTTTEAERGNEVTLRRAAKRTKFESV